MCSINGFVLLAFSGSRTCNMHDPSSMVDEGTDFCFESRIQSLHMHYIYIYIYIMMQNTGYLYRSAAKERPSSKEHLYFWPNSLYRVKGYLNKRSPWSNLRAAHIRMESEKHMQPRALCHIRRLLQGCSA